MVDQTIEAGVDYHARTHEVFNQSRPLEGYNSYTGDIALREAVRRHGAAWAEDSLLAHGERCGSAEICEWGFLANEHKLQFFSHDRQAGRRGGGGAARHRRSRPGGIPRAPYCRPAGPDHAGKPAIARWQQRSGGRLCRVPTGRKWAMQLRYLAPGPGHRHPDRARQPLVQVLELRVGISVLRKSTFFPGGTHGIDYSLDNRKRQHCRVAAGCYRKPPGAIGSRREPSEAAGSYRKQP